MLELNGGWDFIKNMVSICEADANFERIYTFSLENGEDKAQGADLSL